MTAVDWTQAHRGTSNPQVVGPWLCCVPACDEPAVVQMPLPAPTDEDVDATRPVMACAEHADLCVP